MAILNAKCSPDDLGTGPVALDTVALLTNDRQIPSIGKMRTLLLRDSI